jgi:hypothetical protein
MCNLGRALGVCGDVNWTDAAPCGALWRRTLHWCDGVNRDGVAHGCGMVWHNVYRVT